MYVWEKSPMTRFVVVFVIGIILAVNNICFETIFIPVISILIVLFFIFLKYFKSHSYRCINAIVLNLIILISANFYVSNRTEINQKKHFSNFSDKNSFYSVYVNEPPQVTKKTVKILGDVNKVISHDSIIATKGKILLYLEKDSASQSVKYGDIIHFKGVVNQVDAPKNPFVFNYKNYLASQQIFHQKYCSKSSYFLSKKSNPNIFFQFIYNLRITIINFIREDFQSQETASIVEALLVGYKTNLDADLKEAFVQTGAVHVLAVSGLHVGIIFILMSKLLFFLNRIKNGFFYKTIIVLFVIWTYALLTGLFPSVFRAATMFSFIAIGQNLGRQTNIYNSISVSAVLLLLINPFLILQLGFQLSYLAVVGIVYLQPKIYQLVKEPKNLILRYVWSLTSVSIAAQIFVSPISILYFHQFPSYFLVSNIIVIPSVAVIIYVGFAFIITKFAGLNFLSDYIGIGLEYIVKALNFCIFQIQSLPFSSIQNININILEVSLLYTSLFLAIVYFKWRKKYLVFAFTFTLLGGTSSLFLKNYKNLNKKEIVFFSVRKKTLVLAKIGKKAFLIGKNRAFQDKKELNFLLKNYIIKNGISQNNLMVLNLDIKSDFKSEYLLRKNNFIKFRNVSMFFIDNNFIPPQTKMEIDYLILCQNSNIKMKEIEQYFDYKQIILGTTNSFFKIRKWEEESLKINANVYNLNTNGAFILNNLK